MTNQKQILCFGEVLWDVLPGGEVLGGAPFNLAYRLASLGDRGIIASRLGNDEKGRRAFVRISGMGLATDFIQIDDLHPTGTNIITFDDGDAKHDLKREAAYDFIETTSPLLEAARSSDCLNFGTLIQRSLVSRGTLEQMLVSCDGTLRLLDLNLRKDCYSRETILFSLEHADVLKLNESEVSYLAELFGIPSEPLPAFSERTLERWHLSHIIATLGERGACAFTGEKGFHYKAGYKVKVNDSEGCGDAFTAGFIHMLLRGEHLEACITFGNVMGAIVAAQRGATAPVREEDISHFVHKDHEPIVDERLKGFL